MQTIDARTKAIQELLSGQKYTIDYFQREYRWETKNILELINDLEAKFLSSYDDSHERHQVSDYDHYFLGSVVISHKDGKKGIIDGQQRMTSLTLLLIYLHNLQKQNVEKVNVRDLIFSEKFGQRSFNFNVAERTDCMEALFNGQDFDITDQSESVRNMKLRYDDIEEIFPDTLKDEVLPFFIDWLIYKVVLVEITAFTDEDAYTIFETMNDRGLSLNPTDMLKGYLLANISDNDKKEHANQLWKKRILELMEIDKEAELDFFKAWFRAKYAQTIRERKKGSVNQEFEKIGTSFHKFIREEKDRIGLNSSHDFYQFIIHDFNKFSRHYIQLRKAALEFNPKFEYVFYNSYNNFTLQFPLILAAIHPNDEQEIVEKKIKLVSGFIDNFIIRRAVNFRTLGYSAIVYTMFNLMKEIRNLDLIELANILKRKTKEINEPLEGVSDFRLHQQNRRYVHFLLARITYHIEKESHIETNFQNYVSRTIKKPFEIEHLWADKYERHQDEFGSPEAFAEYRNRLGGLILLPRGFNQSLGANEYKEKVKHYYGQNLLAKSLNEQCYTNNPSFKQYLDRSGLPFKAYPDKFSKEHLDERQELYLEICKQIWDMDRYKI
jgi:uncharacterized protein with ParB-like and HNH nuclease domain